LTLSVPAVVGWVKPEAVVVAVQVGAARAEFSGSADRLTPSGGTLLEGVLHSSGKPAGPRPTPATELLTTWLYHHLAGEERPDLTPRVWELLDPELPVKWIRERYVAPFYLRLMSSTSSAGAPSSREWEDVRARMREVADEVTPDLAIALWGEGWREAFMASWWGGGLRSEELVGRVEPLLIPSRATYAGRAHCFGLSRVPSPRSLAVLLRYLYTYLPHRDVRFDQPEAMAAASWVADVLGERLPGRYHDMWRHWTGAEDAVRHLEAGRKVLADMHAFADDVVSHTRTTLRTDTAGPFPKGAG